MKKYSIKKDNKISCITKNEYGDNYEGVYNELVSNLQKEQYNCTYVES